MDRNEPGAGGHVGDFDGAVVGEATVNSYTKAYSFNANITADQAHLIKIHYNNSGSFPETEALDRDEGEGAAYYRDLLQRVMAIP